MSVHYLVFDRFLQQLRAPSRSNCSKNDFSSSSARLSSEITLLSDTGASFLFLLLQRRRLFLSSSSTTFGYTSKHVASGPFLRRWGVGAQTNPKLNPKKEDT